MASTTCAIAGCGPAGAVLGFLLARAGIDVVVLEKHNDFLRDFRGDTIHPSTLELLDQLGLADEFLKLPHSRVSAVQLQTTGGDSVRVSLERVPSKFPFIAFMPQWDFLNFMTAHAARLPTFTLVRNAEVTGLIETDGVIKGLRYRDGAGEHDLSAVLTVGADGRSAVTREAARLPRLETSAPIDVFWFRLPRRVDEAAAVFGRLGPGLLLVMLNRNDYWQVAFIFPKGTGDDIRARGLEAFRQDLVRVAPELADRVNDIQSWDQVKLLTVRVDRLTRWHRPGYLAIGDAAHAMSPVGGLGINVAIQDAVAAANVLWRPLSDGRVSDADLARVQRRRERPVRVLQAFQSLVQNRFLKPALMSKKAPSIPWVIKLILRIPFLRDVPPRMIALGIDRPHVESPSAIGDKIVAMNLAYLQTLLDYHYWARDIILDAVNELPREKFTQPVESSFKSLRDTVAHLYAADWVWYARWVGESPTALIDYTQFPDATSIRTAWKELEGKVRPLVDSLGEEGVHKTYDYKLLSGAPDTAPFWQMFVHVVNHGAYHRGQVTTLMRQLGAHPPKPTDMIAFFRTRR